MSMQLRADVEFGTRDDITHRGWLYRPAGDAPSLEPKKLVLIDGSHFTPYPRPGQDPAGFVAARDAAVAWFAEHL
jgi:fermentation-respiration switch protein FrsA (DUF1100 family)